MELHVRPDLPLLLCEFLRRYDAPYPIPDGLPLRVQLLDQHLQLFLTLLAGVGADAFEMFDAVRSGGQVRLSKRWSLSRVMDPIPGFRAHLMTGWKSVSGFCAVLEDSGTYFLI